MSETNNTELLSFQSKVLKEVETLQTMVGLKAELGRAPSGAAATDKPGLIESVIRGVTLKFSQNLMANMMQIQKIDELTRAARAFLKEHGTREMLCQPLRTVEENLERLTVRDTQRDAEEIAGAITPLLFPVARTEGASLPLDPLAFALSAWMIARTGIKNYCEGFNRTEPLSL
jgi:hypothetical protein